MSSDMDNTYFYVTPDDMESLGNIQEYNLTIQWDKRDPVQKFSFKGELLGAATSQKPTHKHPPGGNPLPNGTILQCSGCRWSEFKVYQQYLDGPKGLAYGQYIITIEGVSLFPFDTHRTRAIWADSSVEVIAGLSSAKNGNAKMTFTAREALREAAVKDQLIAEDLAIFEEK